MPARDPTKRFTDRAADYARFRPGYPAEVVTILQQECGLTASWIIADVGAGTGLLTERLLGNGNRVLAVEPNEAMREAARQRLARHEGFEALPGRSEATGLPDESVDLVTVAQAIHWFEPEKTAAEFRRILRSSGSLAVVNNQRDPAACPLLAELETALDERRNTPRRGEGWWGWDDSSLEHYFGPTGYVLRTCPNEQVLDEEGFLGRWRSNSRSPREGEPRYEELQAELRRIFAKYQQQGRVTVKYTTQVHCGRLAR